MEVGGVSSVERTLWACSVMEAVAVETVHAAWKSLAYLFFVVHNLPFTAFTSSISIYLSFSRFL